ncbi:hypothetical protein [Aeromonas hydrophila]|uniref:hypothetical protein n=1 Tax=Aeromonas hydrophila TaxID=644 RepID=UPI00259F3250|nr:hypothetical protein [Aeromonas hydrophila]MDM5119962.1 hypothetical protein [Aeromonas hydrophila]
MAVTKTQIYDTTVIQFIKANGEVMFLLRGEDGDYTEVSGSYGFECCDADKQAQSLEWYAKRVQLDAEYHRS